MFFVIPLALILLSLFTICLIAWRKFPYLKKLSEPVRSIQTDSSPDTYNFAGLFADFFPEIFYQCKRINFDAYKNSLLKEFEKLLRRLRVLSLKIDSFTNNLIRKIKSENLKNGNIPAAEFKTESEQPALAKKENSAENHKREEQLLIIEIAKNPKNPELYKKLADTYIALRSFPDAVESLEAALELDPEDRKTKEKLGIVKKNLPT